MDDLSERAIISIVRDKIHCIKFVVKYLNSENSEASNEARRIRKNLEEGIKTLKEDQEKGEFPVILNKNFSPINFEDYAERLKSEKDLDSIIEELRGPFYLTQRFFVY